MRKELHGHNVWLVCDVCLVRYRAVSYHCGKCHRTFTSATALERHFSIPEGADDHELVLIGLRLRKDDVWSVGQYFGEG